jgi:hypothetical protein
MPFFGKKRKGELKIFQTWSSHFSHPENLYAKMDNSLSFFFLLSLFVLHTIAVLTNTQDELKNQNPELAKSFQPPSNNSFVDRNSEGANSKVKSFFFVADCFDKLSEVCLGTKKLVESVEERLNSLFNLKSTIRVFVFVKDNDSYKEDDRAVATASTNKYVAIKIPELAKDGKRVPVKSHRTSFVDGYEGVYRVPLALAKQMDLDDTLKNQYTMVEVGDNLEDFIIEINPRQKYFYGVEDDYDGLVDLEAAIMHEVLVRDSLVFIYFSCSFGCGIESP